MESFTLLFAVLNKKRTTVLLFSLISFYARSQGTVPILGIEASDPSFLKTRATLEVESHIFHQPVRFYSARIGYLYALQNQKHQFGISVPFVHNIFNADLQGFENTTGIGDIRMWYMGAFVTSHSLGVVKVAPYVEMIAPTGSYLLGRGAGSWLYKPGVIFSYRLDPQISFYPELRFQFSLDDVNSRGGIDGIPDPEDAQKDGKLQTLTLEVPAVVQLESIRAWFAIHAIYAQSFEEREYFIFFRTDFGKMISDYTSAGLFISKFVAGTPRLNVIVHARLQFFF